MLETHIIGFNYKECYTFDEGYSTLKVILQGTDKSIEYLIPQDATDPNKFQTNVETNELIEGRYNYFLIGVLQNEEVVIYKHVVLFQANPQTGKRVRGFYETIIGNIEAFLSNPNSIRHSEYEIAGRQIKRIPIDQLIKLRDRYSRLVELEIQGVSTSKTPRFTRMKF